MKRHHSRGRMLINITEGDSAETFQRKESQPHEPKIKRADEMLATAMEYKSASGRAAQAYY